MPRRSSRPLASPASLAFCLRSRCAAAAISATSPPPSPAISRPRFPATRPACAPMPTIGSKVYSAHPGEKFASINYARGLRALTRYKEAAAVMQAAAVKAPKDYEVLGEYGKALADAGDLQQARDVLSRSYPPTGRTGTILSAQGSVADRLDDHAQAQQYYSDALKIAPDEPAVLCNLGLPTRCPNNSASPRRRLRRAATLPRADCPGAAESRAGAGARRQVRRGRAGQPRATCRRRRRRAMCARSAT